MIKLFFFDTETTSLKDPHIIQFAYMITDDTGNILETYNQYFTTIQEITKDSTYIHGITPEKVIEEGLDPIIELPNIHQKMIECDKVISHNIDFDMKAISITREKLGLNIDIKYNTFCTMRRSKYFVGLYNDKGWIKWPKLIELYTFLRGEVGDVEDKLHDAMEDVKVLKDCFFLAKSKGYW